MVVEYGAAGIYFVRFSGGAYGDTISADGWARRSLDFAFNDRKAEDLYRELKGEKDYPADVVANFFEVMAVIAAATDERDFYALKSLHFEKLEGKLGKEGRRSMRITKQWRLIVSLEDGEAEKTVVVWKIDKHTYR
ncbi:MAG TPA: type II toxin-antitoxin system RelE/ParE family toxin [Oculatellaceae cyanobacterium]